MMEPLSRKSASVLLCLAAVALLPGCSANKAKKAAEVGVVTFHSQLNAGQYHDIYSHASEAFQKSGTETEMAEFLSMVVPQMNNSFGRSAASLSWSTIA
jgi:hypothetical protein